MRKLLVGIVALGLLGGCNHGEIRKADSVRQQVLQLPDGADYVGQCETIQNTVTPTQLKAEGWTLDECFKAFL